MNTFTKSSDSQKSVWHAKMEEKIKSNLLQFLQKEGLEEQWRPLLEKFVKENVDYFIEQHRTFYQQVKQIYCKWPSSDLPDLVLQLEEDQDNDRFIKVLLRKAPNFEIIEAFIRCKFALVEWLWLCFAEWIRTPTIQEVFPKSMLEAIQKVFPLEMPDEERKEMYKAIREEVIGKCIDDMHHIDIQKKKIE